MIFKQHSHSFPRCGKPCPVTDKQRKQTALPGWTSLDDTKCKSFLRRGVWLLRKTKETSQKQRLSWASYKLKTKSWDLRERRGYFFLICGDILFMWLKLPQRSLQCQGSTFDLFADKRHCRRNSTAGLLGCLFSCIDRPLEAGLWCSPAGWSCSWRNEQARLAVNAAFGESRWEKLLRESTVVRS